MSLGPILRQVKFYNLGFSLGKSKQVAQRATMLTWEPLYKARKNGNINFSDT